MSRQLGLDVLRADYDSPRIPVMEHFAALSRDAIVTLAGLDPVRDPGCLCDAWDALAETLDVDLLWGGPLAEAHDADGIFDWGDGMASKLNAEGEEVVQWGIMHAVKAEDGRHFRHIPHPQSIDDALDFDPAPYFPETVDQLYEHFQQQHDRFVTRNGDRCYTLPCWYTTCFHFPLAIFGFELLCLAGLEEDRFERLMQRFVAITERVTTAWSRVEGLRGFILHDDLTITSGPLFRPDWYRRHIFPHYPRLFAPLIEKGIPILFTTDGDCSAFVDDIFDAGADGLNFEYLVDMADVVKRYPDKLLVGNLNSSVLAQGPISRIEDHTRACIEAGAKARRFVVNVGGHLTHDIPTDHLLAYLDLRKQLCRETRDGIVDTTLTMA